MAYSGLDLEEEIGVPKYRLDVAMPADTTPKDVQGFYEDIQKYITDGSAYSWEPVEPALENIPTSINANIQQNATEPNNKSAEPSSTYVLKKDGKEVFRASQTSASFNTPLDENILEAYLLAMKGKMPVIVVNNCANLQLAEQLLRVAKKTGVKVGFTDAAINAISQDQKVYGVLRKIADLPRYKSESIPAENEKHAAGLLRNT